MKLNDPHSFFLEGTNGKGALLIHGMTGVPAEMKLVAKGLNRQGYSVYAPLLAGHGVDAPTLNKTSWQDWLDSVLVEGNRFRQTVDSMSSAGICVGGKLGMIAALKQPNLLDATAIYSTCFRYDGWHVPGHYRWLSYLPTWTAQLPVFRDMTFGETPSIGIKDERLRKMMQQLSTEGVLEDFPVPALAQMLKLSAAVKQQLPHMRTPTLILHAREDDLSHPRNAIYLDRHLAAPHELHWLENSYHMIHVDREHTKVAKLTGDFFDRMGGANHG